MVHVGCDEVDGLVLADVFGGDAFDGEVERIGGVEREDDVVR